mmetsp:Transcript_13339/g.32380  ORF Transcript_13339/g.32380 Transcript_13339/m.32380 type:complete len:230 (-) Transcript_13339:503-1192(-)
MLLLGIVPLRPIILALSTQCGVLLQSIVELFLGACHCGIVILQQVGNLRLQPRYLLPGSIGISFAFRSEYLSVITDVKQFHFEFFARGSDGFAFANLVVERATHLRQLALQAVRRPRGLGVQALDLHLKALNVSSSIHQGLLHIRSAAFEQAVLASQVCELCFQRAVFVLQKLCLCLPAFLRSCESNVLGKLRLDTVHFSLQRLQRRRRFIALSDSLLKGFLCLRQILP